MKKIKFGFIMLLMMVLLGMGGTPQETRAEAATLTNVMNAPKAKAGKWVITAKGYRYKFTATGKYAKSVWRKIDGNIYFFKSDGYLKTGFKTYGSKKYYLNKQGILQTGWVTVGGKKYYFSKKTGAALTGKQKIGSVYYYFSKNSKKLGQRLTGWIKISGAYYYFQPSNGAMAVSQKIGNYYVDANGRRKTSTTNNSSTADSTTKTGTVDVWVGDSRTVGLGQAKGISSKCIAKVGAGYSWYTSGALAQLKKKLKSKPTATVVLNFGVNDVANISSYITAYRNLIKKYPKAHIYIMSVNPIDSKYSGYVTNSKIKAFNKKMKTAFSARYIDCYSYLVKNGYSTHDGLHYTNSTYKKIYKFVLGKV